MESFTWFDTKKRYVPITWMKNDDILLKIASYKINDVKLYERHHLLISDVSGHQYY